MKPIDGQELLNELDSLLQDHEDEAYTPEDIRTTIMLMMLRAPAVSNAPTVHAHWAVVPSLFNKRNDEKTYRRTNCNKIQIRSLTYPNYRYCPYCGARMDGGEPERG